MFKIILSFFLLGLSFGIGPCLVSCGPLLISYLAGTNKKFITSILAYFLFSLSRIFVYICLSLIIFLFGELIVKYKLEFLSIYIFIFAGIFIIIIGLLVAAGGNDLVVASPLAGRDKTQAEACGCHKFFAFTEQFCQKLHKFFLNRDNKTVILLGLIIGLLPCAPLISVSSYIGLVSKQWMDSIIYSISFGLGTMVSPLFLLVLSGGAISKILIAKDKLRRILDIICGLIIIFLGIGIIKKIP